MAERSLPDVLKRLRRRVLWVDSTSAVAWGVIAALVTLVVGVWLDLVLELSASLRIGVLMAAVGCGLAIMIRHARSGMVKGASLWLARRLDEVLNSGGQVVSGVELAAAGPFIHSVNPTLSVGLAQMAVRRATVLANTVPQAAAVPVQAVRRSAGALLLVVGALAVAGLAMPQLAATEWQRFADPFGDHPPFSQIAFTVEPGDAEVVYGSGLDILVTVDGPPLERLDLVWQPEPGAAPAESEGERDAAESGSAEELVPMFQEQSGQWRASLSNITRAASYFVRSGSARSSRFKIRVITVPHFAEVLFRLTPPAYTQLPPTDGPLPPGGLAGLRGTEIRVDARSNVPLSSGTLSYIVQGERKEFALKPPAPGAKNVVGTFAIAGGGRIEIQVADEAGQNSTENYSAPVVELVDERPFVRLVDPKPVSFATPTAVIPVVVSAEDDYGISRLQLYRNLNDSRYLPADLQIAVPPARQSYQVVPLPLELYGLQPGDEIKLFARVEDNDPNGNAPGEGSAAGEQGTGATGKGSESSVVLIRIISHEQFEKMRQTREGLQSLMSKYQQARRRMESLAEEVETLQKQLKDAKPGDPAADEMRKSLEQLAQRMQEEAEALQKLSQEKPPFALDQQLNPQIERLEQKARELQKRTAELAGQPKLSNEELAKQLEKMSDELRGERERLNSEALQPLEMLMSMARLMQDQSRFVELYRRQRDLADRLKSLSDKERADDPALKTRMRDLEEEQGRIRLELDGLLSDIEDYAAQLPEDEEVEELRRTAQEFVAALRESGADEAMTAAEQALAEFSGKRGHASAEEAADILEKFLSKCKSMGKEGACKACRAKFSPKLSDAIQQTLEQMMSAGMGGSGMGDGGEGGYSARSGPYDNVGLYGQTPLIDSAQAAGQGQSSKPAGDRAGRSSSGRKISSDERAGSDAAGAQNASGGNDASTPLRYRRQVGRYFQRIADELGEIPQDRSKPSGPGGNTR